MYGCEIPLVVVALVLAIAAWRKTRALDGLALEVARLREELAALRAERRGGVAPPAAAAESTTVSAPAPPPPATPAPAPLPFKGPPAPAPRVEAAAPAPAAARPEPRFEERLAARLPVWIGSAALFLAGAFLVKYSFDRGLLGPAARVALGVLFGLVLVGLGEGLRRRLDRIAQGLAAAGIAVLYASLLAGTSLYGLIPRGLGFGLLAATTAAAVLLSLRHGPFIAVLGLLGGFLTPALIGAAEPHAPALFGYLFVLQAGLFAVSRPRRWWPLAALTIAGGAAWSCAWLLLWFRSGDELSVGLYLVASLALVIGSVRLRLAEGDAWDARDEGRAMVLGGGAVAIALLVLLASKGAFGALEWGFLVFVAGGCLVLARVDAVYEPLAWLAALAGLVTLVAWAAGAEVAPAGVGPVALAFGGVVAAGAFVAHSGARSPARWTALSGLAGPAFLLCAWALTDAPATAGWAVRALPLAAAYAAAAALPYRRGLGAAAVAPIAAAVGLAAAAAAFGLREFTLTVAWAALAAAVALAGATLRLPALRWGAAALGAAVLARLLLNMYVPDYHVGAWPVLNGLLFGYGASAAALAAAALVWRRERAPAAWSDVAEWGAIALVAALLLLEVRHAFHGLGGDPRWFFAERVEVAEGGAMAAAVLALALALLVAARTVAPRDALVLAGRALAAGASVVGVAALGTAVNPLFQPLGVGALPLLNALLAGYGLPALLALALAVEFTRRGEEDLARLTGVASLLLFLLLLVLEVRQAFHGTLLHGGATTPAELYSYSAALVVFALVLLGLAIVRRGAVLRWSSLAVMLLAVAKVFLYDLSELRDLYRVFSFLGLGISLLVIAYLYQRFVFRPAGDAGP